jgi:hypothetical protein
MAATIFGFGTDELKPQPGLSISRSESGGWSATHEIIIKASDFADVSSNFARGTLLSALDPTVPAPFGGFLAIDTVQFVRSEGDLYVFSVTATGGEAQFNSDPEDPGLSSDALPTYTLTGQLQDVPFSMHPKWKALSDFNKTLLGNMIDGILWYVIEDNVLRKTSDNEKSFNQFNIADTDAIDFAKRIQQGQTTYQKSSYTWTESTEGADQLTAPQINKLGKIATPRGTPPKAAGTRDWMLTSVSQSQSGELYRTNLEWTLSEEDGWDEFLYSDSPPPP